MKNIFFALTASIFLFASCDYVEVPHQAGGSVVVPTSDTVRKIFIEDFTGHTCPNCPKAARQIDTLKQRFPGQIISMAIHTPVFGTPCPPAPLPAGATAGTFTEDFRVTQEDVDYDNLFQVNSFPYPSLFVNRSGYPASMIIGEGVQTDDSVAHVIVKPITAYLKITPNYNSTTRALTVNVSGKFMHDTSGTFNIAIYLTEDSLTGAQEDNTASSGFDYNYVFNDVFRGCVNSPGSISGAQAITGTITANTGINYTSTASYSVPAVCIPAHCHVVAILYKTSDYGILQAAESKLIP